jgi:hypothetical protein
MTRKALILMLFLFFLYGIALRLNAFNDKILFGNERMEVENSFGLLCVLLKESILWVF